MVHTSCLISCQTSQENRNDQENIKTSQNYNLVPSLSPKIIVLSILAKICRKAEIKIFLQCEISHGNQNCLKYFVHDSRYLFQGFISFFNYSMSAPSKCTIKIPAKTGLRVGPIWHKRRFVGKYFFYKLNERSSLIAITIFS